MVEPILKLFVKKISMDFQRYEPIISVKVELDSTRGKIKFSDLKNNFVDCIAAAQTIDEEQYCYSEIFNDDYFWL